MNDDQRLLASAALDGAVTSEERARAEADPDVVAEIERLRAVRAALRVDDAPDAARREAAITAALAAFEATPPPPSLASRRRSRWMAPLAAAAAVAAIAVGAVVVMRDGDGGDDDLATESMSVATAADDASGAAESESPPAAAPQVAEDGDLLAEAPAGTEASAEAATEATEPSELTATATVVVTLRSSDDLADFARRARVGEQADAARVARCGLGTPLGTALFVDDGTPVPVEIYEIADPHEVVAAEVDGCAIVARAPLP